MGSPQPGTEACRSCGAGNPEGRFCGSCGASLAAMRACPQCGAENPAGQPFCNSCGAGLSGGVAPDEGSLGATQAEARQASASR